MTFANPLLLAGTLLVAVPIVLHLIMRRKPRHFEFPALRFIQKRHENSQRRLRLRHLLLLALRVAAIGLFAMALARPSLKLSGGLGSQKAPVAAAMVFDTSPRMDYRHRNRTRLETAQRMGLDLLTGLPPESQVAVLDSRPRPGAFQVDPGAARDRIERLASASDSRSLVEAVDQAADLLAESELARREIYIFTDLTQAAWPDGSADRLRRRLDGLADVGLYLIDVGVSEPTNTALGELNLSEQVLSGQGPLRIETELFHRGPDAERTVELYLPDSGRLPRKRDQKTISLTSGRPQAIEFQVGSFEQGTHQGHVQIVGADGLACDDRRFFTLEVKPAWRVLLVGPRPAERYARFLGEALAPTEFRRTGRARFDCHVIPLDRLAAEPLEAYGAVCLLDPEPIAPLTWRRLADYAADGGGVAVFLGRNAQRIASFNHPVAQETLAAKLVRQARGRLDFELYLAPDDFQHPILTSFDGLAGSVPWDAFPVFRYWELEAPGPGVHVVAAYTDGRPAILERPFGKGRVVTVTTPVSDSPANQNAWNVLPTGWPFVILAPGMISYLVGAGNERLNYFAGQSAVLELNAEKEYDAYVLSVPDALDVRVAPDLKEQLLTVASTDRLGNYRVRAGGSDSGVDRGFSVNLARQKTDLERTDSLEKIFGTHPYQIARNAGQLEIKVAEGRVGRNLFPILIVLVAVLLAVEHVLANRFYRE